MDTTKLTALKQAVDHGTLMFRSFADAQPIVDSILGLAQNESELNERLAALRNSAAVAEQAVADAQKMADIEMVNAHLVRGEADKYAFDMRAAADSDAQAKADAAKAAIQAQLDEATAQLVAAQATLDSTNQSITAQSNVLGSLNTQINDARAQIAKLLGS